MKKLTLLTTVFSISMSISAFAADQTTAPAAAPKAKAVKTAKAPAAKKVVKPAQATANTKEVAKTDDTKRLDTVTVVATRSERDVQDVPQMVNVIDANAPSKATSTNLADLFKDTAAVVYGGGPVRSAQSPTMRGFDADSILVTLDGRRQNFEAQHSSKIFIDPSLIKKVEVVEGPSSASYGSGAIGGVIAFETKDAKDFVEPGKNSGVVTSVGVESANRELSESVTGYQLIDKYDAIASIIHRNSNDDQLNNGTKQQTQDALTSGIAKLTYDIDSDSQLKFDVSSFYDNAKEYANPGTVDSAQRTLDNKDIFSHQAGVKYNFNPSKLVDFSTQLYYAETDIIEQVLQPVSGLTTNGEKLSRKMQTIGFNADNKSIVSIGADDNNTFAYGFEYFHNTQDGDDSTTGTGGTTGARGGVPDATADIAGLYLQDEVRFDLADNYKLLVTPGARLDYYNNDPQDGTSPSDTEHRISPKLGTTLKIHDNYSIFGNYAEAFRAPNLTELYASGIHFPSGFGTFNTFAPNPYLKPETSRTFEFGGGTNFKDLFEEKDEFRVKASRYITRASDYIDQNVTGPNFGVGACTFPFTDPSCNGGTTSFTNVSSANIWGYDLQTAYDNSLIEAKANLAFVSAENARTGAYLTTQEPLIVTTNLGYKFTDIDSIIGYEGKYVDGMDRAYTDNSNPSAPIDYRRGGFATHGVYWSYTPHQLKSLSLDLAVDNIFDKQYREPGSEIYDLERNYKARVTYKW